MSCRTLLTGPWGSGPTVPEPQVPEPPAPADWQPAMPKQHGAPPHQGPHEQPHNTEQPPDDDALQAHDRHKHSWRTPLLLLRKAFDTVSAGSSPAPDGEGFQAGGYSTPTGMSRSADVILDERQLVDLSQELSITFALPGVHGPEIARAITKGIGWYETDALEAFLRAVLGAFVPTGLIIITHIALVDMWNACQVAKTFKKQTNAFSTMSNFAAGVIAAAFAAVPAHKAACAVIPVYDANGPHFSTAVLLRLPTGGKGSGSDTTGGSWSCWHYDTIPKANQHVRVRLFLSVMQCTLRLPKAIVANQPKCPPGNAALGYCGITCLEVVRKMVDMMHPPQPTNPSEAPYDYEAIMAAVATGLTDDAAATCAEEAGKEANLWRGLYVDAAVLQFQRLSTTQDLEDRLAIQGHSDGVRNATEKLTELTTLCASLTQQLTEQKAHLEQQRSQVQSLTTALQDKNSEVVELKTRNERLQHLIDVQTQESGQKQTAIGAAAETTYHGSVQGMGDGNAAAASAGDPVCDLSQRVHEARTTFACAIATAPDSTRGAQARTGQCMLQAQCPVPPNWQTTVQPLVGTARAGSVFAMHQPTLGGQLVATGPSVAQTVQAQALGASCSRSVAQAHPLTLCTLTGPQPQLPDALVAPVAAVYHDSVPPWSRRSDWQDQLVFAVVETSVRIQTNDDRKVYTCDWCGKSIDHFANWVEKSRKNGFMKMMRGGDNAGVKYQNGKRGHKKCWLNTTVDSRFGKVCTSAAGTDGGITFLGLGASQRCAHLSTILQRHIPTAAL